MYISQKGTIGPQIEALGMQQTKDKSKNNYKNN